MTVDLARQITVEVNPTFKPKYSRLEDGIFVHAYRVTIKNNSPHAVQLIRRHWKLTDAFGLAREVDGEGVLGVQPIIESGSHYHYESACDFNTFLGKIEGHYTMVQLPGNVPFQVNIPTFKLEVPAFLN